LDIVSFSTLLSAQELLEKGDLPYVDSNEQSFFTSW